MNVEKAEIMLYVSDVEAGKRFWMEKIGLPMIEKRKGPENSSVYVFEAGHTVFVLMDRALVKKYSPEVNSTVPSIMFCVEDLEKTYLTMKQNQVKVTEMMVRGHMKTFSFCDHEENYFAIKSV